MTRLGSGPGAGRKAKDEPTTISAPDAPQLPQPQGGHRLSPGAREKGQTSNGWQARRFFAGAALASGSGVVRVPAQNDTEGASGVRVGT